MFDHPVTGPLMRSCTTSASTARTARRRTTRRCATCATGEVVGVFPEATISRSFLIKELKTGAVRMAEDADVPLVPMILWGTQRLFTKDHPKDFSRHKTISVTHR